MSRQQTDIRGIFYIVPLTFSKHEHVFNTYIPQVTNYSDLETMLNDMSDSVSLVICDDMCTLMGCILAV